MLPVRGCFRGEQGHFALATPASRVLKHRTLAARGKRTVAARPGRRGQVAPGPSWGASANTVSTAMESSSAEAGTSGAGALDVHGSEGADLDTAVAVIASYSPAEIVLRYALQENPTPPQSEEREDFDSAIGFVDVSGFTALSEKLKKDETQLGLGSELLNRCASSVGRSHAPPPAARRFRSPRRSIPTTAASSKAPKHRAGTGGHLRRERAAAALQPAMTRPRHRARTSMSAWCLAWQVHQPVLRGPD